MDAMQDIFSMLKGRRSSPFVGGASTEGYA
jgi:hypothetical protein